MQRIKRAAHSILFIAVSVFIIEGAYRFIRFVQFRSLDVLIYPATVNNCNEDAYFIDFKPRQTRKNGIDFTVKSQMFLSRLVRFTEFRYKNRFGAVDIRMSRFKNYTAPKKNNEIRIVTLGGSSTYGDGVNDDQTYSAYLEKKLNSYYKNVRITVINGGARGKNLEERKDKSRFLFSDFSPDILVCYEGHNSVALPNPPDVKNPAFNKDKIFARLRFPERYSLVYKDIFETVKSFLLASEKIKSLNNLLCADKDESAGLKENFDNQAASFKNNINELVRDAERKKVLLLLSNQLIWIDNLPAAKDKALVARFEEKLENAPQNLTACEGFYLLHEKYMDLLKESDNNGKGVYFLDIYPKFKGVNQARVLQDRVHLTVRGNKMVAEAMADFIISRELIEKIAEQRKAEVADKKKPEIILSREDVIIAKTVKFIAKSIFPVFPFEKIKAEQMKKIKRRTEEDFNRLYAKFYEEISGTGLESMLGLSEECAKDEALKRIDSLSREDVLSLIDAVPDYFVVLKLKEHFNKEKQNVEKQDMIEWFRKKSEKAIKKAAGE